MTHQEIGLRTNNMGNVNGYIPPEYITLMNVMNPPSPALRLRRELMRKLSLCSYTRGRIDGTKSNDVERRKRLTTREREMKREIVETEIALNRCDPGYAVKFPGGYFHRRGIFEMLELEHDLCDGLQQHEIRLMSNHAIQQEELRNRNLSRLPNAGYDPNQPRAEDGEWSTDGGGRLFAQADTNEESRIVSQGDKPSSQSISDSDQQKKKWAPRWDPLKDPDVSKQIEAAWKQTKDDSKYQEYGFVVYRDKDGNIFISDVMKTADSHGGPLLDKNGNPYQVPEGTREVAGFHTHPENKVAWPSGVPGYQDSLSVKQGLNMGRSDWHEAISKKRPEYVIGAWTIAKVNPTKGGSATVRAADTHMGDMGVVQQYWRSDHTSLGPEYHRIEQGDYDDPTTNQSTDRPGTYWYKD